MLRVKKRAPNARAARGSGGMLPREILKIVVLYNDFSCILSPLLYHFGWPLKAISHEEICPCNLQCNFCRKKYCRLQLGSQTYATCFATCNEIIFYARRVFRNVSSFSKKIARQVAVGVSHPATCCVALRNVEAASTFSATCNAIFRCETWGVAQASLPWNLQCNAIALQGKLPRETCMAFMK